MVMANKTRNVDFAAGSRDFSGSMGPKPQPLTVTQLVASIRHCLEGAFPFVWVEGEISNLHLHTSGHAYFTLKDSAAQLRAVMFRAVARAVRFCIEDGMRVVVYGRVSIYPPRGDMQLVVEQVEPLGAGALALAFEQLKQRLSREGLFDDARKRPIPRYPFRIGIVTSVAGAALQDMLRILLQRNPRAELWIADTPVQGDGAAEGIVSALRRLVQAVNVELIIVARGGGSLEDLWPFNDERVARAIAACPIPVVSGIGHESDFSIADFVADCRAATPTHAAVMASFEWATVANNLALLSQRLSIAARLRIESTRESIENVARLSLVPTRTIEMQRVSVDRLVDRLRTAMDGCLSAYRGKLRVKAELVQRSHPSLRIALWRSAVHVARTRLADQMQRRYQQRRDKLGMLLATLRAYSPLTTLERGYSITFSAERVIRSVIDTVVDQRLTTRVIDGDIESQVVAIQRHESDAT